MKKTIILVMLLSLFAVESYAWKPVFAGHRGSYTGVQNTAEAFRKGVEKYGYSGLECDVRVTADGKYVICHDETTNSLGGSLTVATAPQAFTPWKPKLPSPNSRLILIRLSTISLFVTLPESTTSLSLTLPALQSLPTNMPAPSVPSSMCRYSPPVSTSSPSMALKHQPA